MLEEGNKVITTNLKDEYKEFGTWPADNQAPIIYHKSYNISFLGFEKWNNLDAWKFYKIFSILESNEIIKTGQHPSPISEVSDEVLSRLHDKNYLEEIQNSKMMLIQITELPALFLLPNFILNSYIIKPLKLQVSGTILAVGIAIERGWAINLGGGMIHAKYNIGSAWCPYDDITLAIDQARRATDNKIDRFLIIDVGAHQGNGYQFNKLHRHDENVIIFDIYNYMIFPKDEEAKEAINVRKELPCGASSIDYMEAIKSICQECANYEFDFIIYVAGTDVYESDYSGQFKVTKEDVVLRDKKIFDLAVEYKVPICMLLSSGFSRENAQVIAESITDIIKQY